LTTFKVVSEYIISGLIVIAIILLKYNQRHFNEKVYSFIFWSLITTILAEIPFIFYIDVYGLLNMLGHLFKLASFYFIYKSINETSLKRPYESLFFKLNQEKEKLKKYINITEIIFFVLNKDGKVKMINDKGCEVLGCEQKKIIGEDWFKNFIKEEERDEVEDFFNKIKNEEVDASETFENNILTKNGEEKTIIWHNTVLKDEDGNITEILSSGMNITERKEVEEKIRYMTYHDSLTGLYNRKFYEEELDRLDTSRQLPLSIIIGDVNGLKLTNDVFGHEMGDKVLKGIADMVKKSTREEDIVARWGGDEFGIILPQTYEEAVQDVMERIKENCKGAEFENIPLSIALGSATKKEIQEEIDDLFTEAEEKMYEDKLDCKSCLKNSVLNSLIKRLEDSNYEIVGHTSRMIDLVKKLGDKLDLSEYEIEELSQLAKFHDIGKLAISNEILNKGDVLTKEEWKKFKQHSKLGYDIAINFSYLFSISEDILSHHERWDGSGYPRGLSGEQIPLLSRIIYVIDFYDAITHKFYYPITKGNYYKEPLSKEEAINEINNNAGKLFDPGIAEKFIELIS
jgi:diguanylate cyclase (GGDEF)-like protein/PAS domain S-box-containing protein